MNTQSRFSRLAAKVGRTSAAIVVSALMPVSSFAQAEQISEPNPEAPLYDRLPEQIREKGHIVSATTGRYPPYNFFADDGQTLQGAGIELGAEIGRVLGVPVKNEISESVAGYITGIESGRFDFILGTVADTAERQKSVDMVDWTSQSTSFLVPAGNPAGIDGISDICGLKVAVQKASFAEPVLAKQSELCVADGKPEVDIKILSDQATMALAVKSGRVDASFAGNAALVYFQSQNADGYDVVGAGENLMGTLWQASITPKDSELTQVIFDAWAMLYELGEYERIMTKWGVDGDMLDAPGINLAK